MPRSIENSPFMRRTTKWLLLAAPFVFMPTEALTGSLLDTANECQGIPADSWALRYCQIRNRYLDLVIMGNASEVEIMAGPTIETERDRCIGRTQELALHSSEIQGMLANLRKNALPRMIKDRGKAAGTMEFQRRAKNLLAALELIQQAPCDQEAVHAYSTLVPLLSK